MHQDVVRCLIYYSQKVRLALERKCIDIGDCRENYSNVLSCVKMACSSSEETKYGYEDSRFEQNVDKHFHCSICYNVLKEPRTCRNNEHLFCLECITQHLKVNSQTCPECSEHLSLDTLRRARVLNNYISKLKINCDFASRGCPHHVCVEDLSTHVANCGFAPAICSNENCGVEMNKQEKDRHETVLCEYRKVTCHDCGRTKESLTELTGKLNATNERMEKLERSLVIEIKNNNPAEMEENVARMNKKIDEKVTVLANKVNDIQQEVKDLKENVTKVNKDVDEVKVMMVQALEKLNNLKLLSKQPSPFDGVLHTQREDILIAGGQTSGKSAEIYCWESGSWLEISPMNHDHAEASSFVHDDQLFVVGGGDTSTIEFLDLNSSPLTWKRPQSGLPGSCSGHRTVVCQQRVFHIGGRWQGQYDVSTLIKELRPKSTSTMKTLCEMPLPRYHHGAETIKNNVLILGGKTSIVRHTDNNKTSDVQEFDPITNVCWSLPGLPRILSGMATVTWRDQVVVLGGEDRYHQTSNDVFMYDSKTGKTTALPSMLKKRYECCAAITGDNIVVMGGRDERGQYLNSAEHFRMGSSTWEYLPAMNKERCDSVAEVLPSTRKYV